jgi:hypothetical protein
MKNKDDGFNEYMFKCKQECTNRIPIDFYDNDSLQRNALRVEGLRDKCERCGMKPPEQWCEGAKKHGWAMWVYSGGSPSVFGVCDYQDCPMTNFYIRNAPKKAWRGLPQEGEGKK